MKELIVKITKPIRNFYFIAGFGFLVWITFFDSNSLINQYKLNQKHKELQSLKTYYEEEISVLEKNMEQLNSDPDALEKFAREKYLFKRRGEEIFILEEKK